jgi:hypothetical protein
MHRRETFDALLGPEDDRHMSLQKGLWKQIAMIAAMSFALICSDAHSQETVCEHDSLQEKALTVFLDNAAYEDYIKENTTFVYYVRDREQAQLHVLMTAQGTGGRGTEYTILFTGRKEFSGVNDTLRCFTKELDTIEQKRSEVLRTMKLGLMRYVSRFPQSEWLDISYRRTGDPVELEDRWDYWAFKISASTAISGQESSKSFDYSGGISADRVTHNWKTSFGLATDYYETTYDVGDREVTKTTDNSSFRGLVVKSLGDHWSVGGYAAASKSLYYNLDRSVTIAPAVEFDVFPYSQSTRRDFRLMYKLEYIFNKYEVETIYFVTEENLYHQEFTIELDVKENWGTMSGRVTASSYLHDFDLNEISYYTSFSFRISEGVSVHLSGSYSAIHDQISLPRRGASAEDILLQRQQLATSYHYSLYAGLSYSFGSKYANIVNPRF